MRDYVVIDLETTGLNPKLDKIIEIGAVKVREGKAVDRFSTFINPGKKLPERIIEITGITDAQLETAPFIEEVFPQFMEFVGNDVLLGHNLIFDYSFVKKAAVNLKMKFEKQGMDTLRISRRFLTGLESKNLGFLCQYYGIPLDAHRAYNDAYATHLLYEKLFEEFFEKEQDTFQPIPLQYQVKKETPITPRQKVFLCDLANRYGIGTEDRVIVSEGAKRHAQFIKADGVCIMEETEIDRMSKNEASRLIDHLLSNYGR